MLVASALGDLGIQRTARHFNGGRGEALIEQRIRMRAADAARRAAEIARLAALTDAQRAAEDAARADVVAEQQAQLNEWAAWKAEIGKTSVPMYTVQGPEPLTDRGRVLQRLILANDLDALFALLPRSSWNKRWHLSKYQFKTVNGKRVYVPWTEADVKKWAFSPYLNIAPGWDCTDERRTAIVAAHWKKIVGTKAKFPDTSDWKHVWPIYPNGAYPGQHYGCQEYEGSSWVRMRGIVYIAVAIVAAVYLGPIVMDKIGGLLANMGGASGAGAGSGAATTATTATKTSAFLSKVSKGVKVYNKLNTVNHIIQGKVPPPPIGIAGSTFAAVAMNAAKDYAIKEAKDYAIKTGTEYVAKKYSQKEEAQMAAEIAKIQAEIARLQLLAPDTPIEPSPELAEPIRQKIIEIQNVERERQADTSGVAVLALAVPAVLLLAGQAG